jgi:hypothetical protein
MFRRCNKQDGGKWNHPNADQERTAGGDALRRYESIAPASTEGSPKATGWGPLTAAP